jgi:hypothetical protein
MPKELQDLVHQFVNIKAKQQQQMQQQSKTATVKSPKGATTSEQDHEMSIQTPEFDRLSHGDDDDMNMTVSVWNVTQYF